MKNKILLFTLALGLLVPFQKSFAHCDSRNGPVVTAAKQALKTNNVNLILIWVQKKDESVVKEAFKKTINLRKISPAVEQVVDNYFFETLVRIHRAGEGVAYTGLKDSGAIEAPIAASDAAIEKNSISSALDLLHEAINKGVNEKFKEVISKKNYDVNNVDAGREYVESYVMFMHYIEAIYNAATHSGAGHREHEAGKAQTEIISTASNENAAAAMEVNPYIETPDRLSYIFIMVGTLLIITVQLFLSQKKSVTT